MNRDILVRGKDIAKNQWVIFDIRISSQNPFVGSSWFDIDKKTISQFTGLLDKNGTKIFEGDIVEWNDGGYWRFAVVEIMPDIRFNCGQIGTVKGILNTGNDHVFKFGSFAYEDTHNHLKVIGNIFDNPELLNQE